MTETNRLRAVMDICDEIVRGNPPTPEVAALVRRIYAAALGDKPELPGWAIAQLSDLGIAPRDVTHFIPSSDGRKIAAAVKGKPVHLTRPV